ncbi:hypothetical protein [uncultured Thiodictyon sp.]|uniref:hypothetical protein n=1 Tax=uncultured Thiodictyon sp. TaxID=1846217 RepID=UPI0025F41A0E|nr:hypothetical protein [uncultured Thiodictyon sp.]
MDGLRCRYATRAHWLADQAEPPGGPRRLALDVICETASGRDARTAALAALTLLDAAGQSYPGATQAASPEPAGAASKPALPQADRAPGLRSRITAPPPGEAMRVRTLFTVPAVLPAGPWQLQLTAPDRTIRLPLELPPE